MACNCDTSRVVCCLHPSLSLSPTLSYSPSSLSLFICGCVCVERREAQSESVSEIAQTEQTSHQTFLFTFDERECACVCVSVCVKSLWENVKCKYWEDFLGRRAEVGRNFWLLISFVVEHLRLRHLPLKQTWFLYENFHFYAIWDNVNLPLPFLHYANIKVISHVPCDTAAGVGQLGR